MSDGIETPQSEIILKHQGREIALIAFFPDGEGGYNSVCGLEDVGALSVVASLLRESAFVLSSAFADRIKLRDLGDVPRMENGEADRPF